MPWEKLAIGLIGILVAIAGWTLLTVVQTARDVTEIRTKLAGADDETKELKKQTEKLDVSVQQLRVDVARLQPQPKKP